MEGNSESQPKLRSSRTERFFREAYENVKTKIDASVIASATGCKGSYSLQKLPGHNRIEETLPDACHTVKDVVQNVMNLITNRNINLNKIIKAEQESGRLDLAKLSNDSADRKFVFSTKPVTTVTKKTKKSMTCKDSSLMNDTILPYILTK